MINIMKNKYQAVLFAPDGDYVTDFHGKDTVREVWDCIADMGSRWVFYPFCCVGTDKTIIEVWDNGPIRLKGKRIKTVSKIINNALDFTHHERIV
jgi:hypothetical protein